ncbi:MAG TPA: UDP-N-acetylmuramoyl-L-alanyl-D-glutamate--2,6-diaminopimelate ligase [Gallionellaceae bacterium]|nr:UDP-N-acetylmuramoyl-L-alanyl-D-glutamate--2,6-diaminopimelate ligase [Gallionellaceae bacterium]
MSRSFTLMPGFHPDLLKSLGVKITRLVTDSRMVVPGDTFIAYQGSQFDGRQFIAQAIAQGANAVIWDAHNFAWNAAWEIPNLALRELRSHAGEIAAQVYGYPSEKLWMVGITGTNGKTSCSHWVAQSFSGLGRKAALIGTLGNGFPPALQPTLNTTPDAIRVHGLLAGYVQQNAQVVAMEVSSHALEQGRVNAVKYDVALLTNLSRDHLDYHGDMTSYAAAKRRLFDWEQLKYAVLNLDDAFGSELAGQLQDAAVEVIGYGLSGQALQQAERQGLRMVQGGNLQLDAQGCRMQVNTSWGGGALSSPLLGRFNAENLLGTLAVLLVSGVSLADALHAVAQLRSVPGRMQTLGGAGLPAVVVDYAHTPDALEKVLLALSEMTAPGGGKLICVFGCGGERDRGKRPMMGTVAGKLADLSIVTSDNPRSENPQDIIAAIVPGIGGSYRIIEDRAQAIVQAIGSAQAADTVLIAGKGHEDYQEIKGVKYPFSDIEIAQRSLRTWPLRRAQDERGGLA